MLVHRVAFILLIPSAVQCQNISKPLSQVEACRNFSDAVVQIDADVQTGLTSNGTGFIVDSDGWIFTAMHVVANKLTPPNVPAIEYQSIRVTIKGFHHSFPAKIVSELGETAKIRDFAIIKISESHLPVLNLGSEGEIEDGSPITIIGFPVSAFVTDSTGARIPVPKFCLGGTIAGQVSAQIIDLDFLHTIYFQGVSVKGISGAPVISLVNGKIIGIVSTKLTGIGVALTQQREQLKNPPVELGGGNGFSLVKSLSGIIDTLDDQLANGLGSATGDSDAMNALTKAKRRYAKEHPRN